MQDAAEEGEVDGVPLDDVVVTLWRRQLQLASLIPFIAGGVVGSTVGRTFPWSGVAVVGVLAGCVLLVLSLWLPAARHRRWRYALGADALHISHGALVHHHSVLPYFRVQHVDVSSGPLERQLGLARLKVRTASSGSDGEIPGLAGPVAEAIRDQLLQRAGATPGL